MFQNVGSVIKSVAARVGKREWIISARSGCFLTLLLLGRGISVFALKKTLGEIIWQIRYMWILFHPEKSLCVEVLSLLRSSVWGRQLPSKFALNIASGETSRALPKCMLAPRGGLNILFVLKCLEQMEYRRWTWESSYSKVPTSSYSELDLSQVSLWTVVP